MREHLNEHLTGMPNQAEVLRGWSPRWNFLVVCRKQGCSVDHRSLCTCAGMSTCASRVDLAAALTLLPWHEPVA
jgi:hypothetical protein